MNTTHFTKSMFAMIALVTSLFFFSCEPDDPCETDPDSCRPDEEIVGQRGNPHFNLQFTNPNQVDLDLYEI